MTNATTKCAHDSCKCVVDPPTPLTVAYEGKVFCGERCADNRGCDHHDCNCGVFPSEESEKREPVARQSAS